MKNNFSGSCNHILRLQVATLVTIQTQTYSGHPAGINLWTLSSDFLKDPALAWVESLQRRRRHVY